MSTYDAPSSKLTKQCDNCGNWNGNAAKKCTKCKFPIRDYDEWGMGFGQLERKELEKEFVKAAKALGLYRAKRTLSELQ